MSISIQQSRAIEADIAVDLDYLPLPTAESLFACRALLAQLEGTDHIEPDHEETTCHDCGKYVAVAWQYGQTIVCRSCRRHRMRAARQLNSNKQAAEITFAATMYALADKRADAIRTRQHDSTRAVPATDVPTPSAQRPHPPR